MSWTPKFEGVDYERRDKFLLSYLKQRPSKDDPAYPVYKDVLAFIAGSVCMRDEYRYVSEGAKAQLAKYNISHPSYKDKYAGKEAYKGLRTEHTIPVKVIVEYLESLSEEELTADTLKDFAEKVSGLALITEEEDKELNNARVRDCLPNGTTLADILSGKAEHSIRYEKAGIMPKPKDNAKA